MTPTHTFSSSERPNALNRALYRAPVSSNVARSSAPFGRTINAGGGSRTAGRSGSYTPGSGGASNVERARQSLGYTGRGAVSASSTTGRAIGNSSTYNRVGDRNTQGATGYSRGVERSIAGSGTVERARQSLGNSGPGSSSGRGSYSGNSSSRSPSSSSGSNTRGSSSYGGRYHSDSQSSSPRSTQSSGRSSGSSSGSSRGSSNSSGSSGGSRGGGGSSRGGGGGGGDRGGGGRGGH
jgi:hypothetical protein